MIGTREVLGLHADGLRLSFGFNRLLNCHRPFLVQHGLGHAMRKCWAVGQFLGQCNGIGKQGVGRYQPVKEAPSRTLLCGHRATGKQQLGRSPLANQARQQSASTHVATGQTDPGKQERRLGAFGAQAKIAGQRNHRAGAGTDAVNCSDDRLRATAHRQNHVAGHAGEFEQLGHFHRDQRADDFVNIAA